MGLILNEIDECRLNPESVNFAGETVVIRLVYVRVRAPNPEMKVRLRVIFRACLRVLDVFVCGN